ncbi:hypothetical protein GJAV_G00172370 [Gymnothorax javanicus]|nr:hypothetical protein GJAV_G00172370 [Gymnothorax javanicus]
MHTCGRHLQFLFGGKDFFPLKALARKMKACFTESMHFLLLLAFQTLADGYRVETIPWFLQPVAGVWNGSVTLPCHIEPPGSAVGLQVQWYSVSSGQPVHFYRNGRDDTILQAKAYQGRTRLFRAELNNGNVSLRLSDLRPSDNGVYRCRVEGNGWEDQKDVTLLVSMTGSQPKVSVDRQGKPRLVCRSEGWFPQPKVTWRDKRGGVVKAQTVHSQDAQGLFTVITDMELLRESDVFSCMVTAGGRSGGASKLHIAEDFYPPTSVWKILFFLSLSLICISIPVLLRAWRELNGKYRRSCDAVTLRLENELAALRRPVKSEWRSIRRHAATVTLDPGTAYNRLVVSEDGQEVYLAAKRLKLPKDSRRFEQSPCVLGRESVSAGRRYWEVEVGPKPQWCLGVCTMSVDRTQQMDMTPNNGYWTLELCEEGIYRAGGVALPLKERPHKVGVYLNYKDGRVSFYNAVTTHFIHTLTDHFTEALYAFFCTGVTGGDIPLVICSIDG